MSKHRILRLSTILIGAGATAGGRLFGMSALPGRPLENLFAVLEVSNSNRRSSVSREIKRTLELRWPRLLFHIERDYRKGRSEAKQNHGTASTVTFRRKFSVSTAPQQHIDLSTHLMKDAKQIAIHYHANCSLTIITAAPTSEILTQKKSTGEAAGLCVFSQTMIEKNVGEMK